MGIQIATILCACLAFVKHLTPQVGGKFQLNGHFMHLKTDLQFALHNRQNSGVS
jgi:hypothetical protein